MSDSGLKLTLNLINVLYLTAAGEAAALVAHRTARGAASAAHRAARTSLLTLLTTRLLLALATIHLNR